MNPLWHKDFHRSLYVASSPKDSPISIGSKFLLLQKQQELQSPGFLIWQEFPM